MTDWLRGWWVPISGWWPTLIDNFLLYFLLKILKAFLPHPSIFFKNAQYYKVILTETIKTPRIHIIGIIKPIPQEILQNYFAHESHIHKVPNLMLASKHWGANLTSLLTSTYPSYHGVWTDGSQQTLGMHATSLTQSFQRAHYNYEQISDKSRENLLLQLGFKAGKVGREQNPPNEVSIDLITSLTDTNLAKIHKKMVEATKHSNSIALLIPMENKNLYSPISAYITFPKKIKPPKIDSDKFHSIIDIAPTIFKVLGLKLPYPWVGQNLANAQTYEYIEDSRRFATIITSEYRMTIDASRKGGQFYHLPSDPEELRNLWNDESFTAKKMEILLTFSSAQLGKEPMPMPRIAGA